MIVQLLFHMYFILREEDTILERGEAGLISSSRKNLGQKKIRGLGVGVRCYMAQLSGGWGCERVMMAGLCATNETSGRLGGGDGRTNGGGCCYCCCY